MIYLINSPFRSICVLTSLFTSSVTRFWNTTNIWLAGECLSEFLYVCLHVCLCQVPVLMHVNELQTQAHVLCKKQSASINGLLFFVVVDHLRNIVLTCCCFSYKSLFVLFSNLLAVLLIVCVCGGGRQRERERGGREN